MLTPHMILTGFGETVGSLSIQRHLYLIQTHQFSVSRHIVLMMFVLLIGGLPIVVLGSGGGFRSVTKRYLAFIASRAGEYLRLILVLCGYTSISIILYSFISFEVGSLGARATVLDILATGLWILTGVVAFVAIHKFFIDHEGEWATPREDTPSDAIESG